MWDIHELLGRVTLQMLLLMVLFSAFQVIRGQPINRSYFTGIIFSGILILLSTLFVFLGIIFEPNESPGPVHTTYWVTSALILPSVFFYEQRNTDDIRAQRLYAIIFIVLTVTVWRGLFVVA